MNGESDMPDPRYSPISSMPGTSFGGVVWVSSVEAGDSGTVWVAICGRRRGLTRGPLRRSEIALEADLGDVVLLLCVRLRRRVVGHHVRGDRRDDGRVQVRVDQRHRSTLGQRLADDLVELLTGELAILVGHGVP